MARRITKASKRRLTLFGTLSVVAIIYFFISLCYNIYVTYSLSMEKKSLEDKYLSLQEESDQLKIDIEKLNDDAYLANYAREHYLYSKDGEYIIKLEDDMKTNTEENIDSLDDMIKSNYLTIALSILMLIIFIYILCKGKKKRKK
ncbi:MAG: septum formation initiator family protein [bacterium]|nr:septum formation initiator family protein [bacterium]